MTLVNRVSAFFLGALALVLASYAVLVYGTVRYYLYHRFDEQLASAFNTLVAAVEVEPDDVKFEQTDHTIRLGAEADVDDIRWAVWDEEGRPVAHSQNLAPSEGALWLSTDEELDGYDQGPQVVGNWRLLRHRLAAPSPKPPEEREPIEHAALLITVGRSNLDLNEHLRRMAVASVLLPLAIWLIAATIGRWYCRRALAPVQAMAEQARQMAPGAAGTRLAVGSQGDELSELGLAFNQLLDRLYASLDRQRRFAGDAAHQLRTPLTVLQGQVDVALRRERTSEEYRQTLAVLRDETGDLRQIVESLLMLARAEGGEQPPDLQPLELDAWLRSYTERWSAHARAADLRLVADSGATVETSPQLCGQLLDNLVANAFKYSPPGSVVTIAVQRRGAEASIAVSDEGPGIAAADQEAIFEPFFRTTAARTSGVAGTGLGLAISHSLAGVLGARLTCTSQPDQGSTFAVHFPSMAATAWTDQAPSPRREERGDRARVGKTRSSRCL